MARFLLTTFGCQMNVHDSDRMHDVLVRARHEATSSLDDADFVVINTCSVREKAEQKLLSEVGRIAKVKRARPELLVVVAGCLAQQEGQNLLRKNKAIDLVVGPDNLAELPMLLEELAAGSPPLVRTVFDTDAPRFLTLEPPGASSAAAGGPTAFVTTMKGCNERCSFCIVPYTRGPERYRSSHEIVEEVKAFVQSGVREITLLGQTVNSYQDPSGALKSPNEQDPDETAFGALLRSIAHAVPDLLRLRYTSPHPRHLTASLIDAHQELPVLTKHVHLPVQSGSNRILRRMIRRYCREEYIDRTTALRRRIPDLTLSSDIIVGFPGETEDDFQQTLSLIEEMGFVGIFGFKYSARPYTPALKLLEEVDESEKSERLSRLFELSERLMSRHLQNLVGTEQEVLFEGIAKRHSGPHQNEAGLSGNGKPLTGRTARNEIVHVSNASTTLIGKVARVSIVRAFKHSLEGQLNPTATADEFVDPGVPHTPARIRLPLFHPRDRSLPHQDEAK